jgi:hypothetical protein
MNRILCHLMLVLVAMATASGCANRTIVTPGQVTPSSDLSLRFEPSRTVVLRTEEGETRALERVVELRGQLIESSGDSILIRTRSVEFADGRTQGFGVGATASIALAEVTMEEVEINGGKTALLVIGIGVLLFALVMNSMSNMLEVTPPPAPKNEDVGK